MKAIVLIQMETGEMDGAIRDLRKVVGVTEAHLTFGPYDAIAVVETEELREIGRIVEREIQPIPGILRTLTCLTISGELTDDELSTSDRSATPLTAPKSFGIN